jgi:tetratricopeptide (TPR) repeat protein
MRTVLVIILLSFIAVSSAAQDSIRVRVFDQNIAEAKNDADKIAALVGLAEYYTIFKSETKADSILKKALSVAEASSDKSLVLQILFNRNASNLNGWSRNETFEQSIGFIKKVIQYTQEINRGDYTALAYIRLAGIYRRRNLYDEAIEQTTHAFTALGDMEIDSIKSVLNIELGDIYIARGDAVPAYKNYNNAFEIAYKQKDVAMQSEIYHRFSEFYRSFGDDEQGRKYLLYSLDLNTTQHNSDGLFKDNMDLARLTNERDYIDRAIVLAEELKSDRYRLIAKLLLYYWYMVEGKNSSQTLHFLFSNNDLVQQFSNLGIANFHWQLANIYRYASRFDSALYFYKLAERELNSGYGDEIKSSIFMAMADSYLQSKDSLNAIGNFEKAFDLRRQMNQLSTLPAICEQLGTLYEKRADYKKAYYYAHQADSANKVLQSNTARDKVVLLQVDRENKKRESDLAEISRKQTRKYNLEIMAITLVLAGVFSFMLFIGMFAVSKTTIRMLSYFAFISLFEFIVLLLDHPIVDLTHAEPLKIWLLKIALIALLVPFQHFLEHRLMKFLQSRKLLEARQRFSVRKWWQRITKPAPEKDDADVEEDTAVL